MSFDLTKKEIDYIAKKNSYTPNNVEKVMRLSSILDALNKLSEFKGKLILKGGTAINIVVCEKLPRLSVDIDLDFHENMSKENLKEEREIINKAIDVYCEQNGYIKSGRNSYALDSLSLTYKTLSGSGDKIKLDINYQSRCHVYNPQKSIIKYPFKKEDSIEVLHLHPIELFAGKIKAFYERCKPRDIYDIYTLSNSSLLTSEEERIALKRCVVYYSTLGNYNNKNLLKTDPGHIKDIPFSHIKAQLLPMLHVNSGKYPKSDIDNKVIAYLSSLMVLSKEETLYIDKFYKGAYQPSLLFDVDTANKLINHPVAKAIQYRIQSDMIGINIGICNGRNTVNATINGVRQMTAYISSKDAEDFRNGVLSKLGIVEKYYEYDFNSPL